MYTLSISSEHTGTRKCHSYIAMLKTSIKGQNHNVRLLLSLLLIGFLSNLSKNRNVKSVNSLIMIMLQPGPMERFSIISVFGWLEKYKCFFFNKNLFKLVKKSMHFTPSQSLLGKCI